MSTHGWLRRVAEDGAATMVEYALIVALIAVVAAASASMLGIRVRDTLGAAANTISGQSGQVGGGVGNGGGHGQGVGGGRNH